MRVIVAVCLLMVSLCIPQTPEQIKESFLRWDRDHDGYLSESEVRQFYEVDYLSEFKNVEIDPQFIRKGLIAIFRHDKNKDGLSQQEFTVAVTPYDHTKPREIFTIYPQSDL